MPRLIALLAVAALLAGCGQRGALYLPEPEREAVVSTPAAGSAAPATTEDAEAEARRQEAARRAAGN